METLRNRSEQGSGQVADEEVTISFTAEVYQMLEEIARKKNKTVTEVVEEAIGLERWYTKTREEGGRIIVEKSNGDKWEIG